MDPGGEGAASSEGCLSQGAWGRTSRYSAGHGGPRGDLLEWRTAEGGGEARASSDGCSSQCLGQNI